MVKQTAKNFLILLLFFVLLSQTTHAQLCVEPPSGLVAWYKGEGNVSDSSGNGHHGTNFSNAGFATGQVGQSILFTEQNQSVPIPNHPSLFPPTSLSIEGWVNPLPYSNCAGDSYRIFHSVQFTIKGYLTFINCANGKLFGVIFDSAGALEAVSSNASIPPNTFTHIAFTWDGSNMRLYINGVLDNTAPSTMPAIGTHLEPLRIGNAQAIGFLGKIDEISLYNRALAGSEVLAIFNAGIAGKCFAPTAAFVSVSGRVLTSSGQGVAGAKLTLMHSNGNVETRLANPFGYYSFETVGVGTAVTLSIAAKGREFIDPVRVISVVDVVTDINFVAVD